MLSLTILEWVKARGSLTISEAEKLTDAPRGTIKARLSALVRDGFSSGTATRGPLGMRLSDGAVQKVGCELPSVKHNFPDILWRCRETFICGGQYITLRQFSKRQLCKRLNCLQRPLLVFKFSKDKHRLYKSLRCFWLKLGNRGGLRSDISSRCDLARFIVHESDDFPEPRRDLDAVYKWVVLLKDWSSKDA